MIRQEIAVCQSCGSLKELNSPCECSDEENPEGDWRHCLRPCGRFEEAQRGFLPLLEGSLEIEKPGGQGSVDS